MKTYVPIKLDKMRNLRYSFKALSRLEEEFGCSIATINFATLSVRQIVTFIWAGLIHEDNDLTVDKVMDLMDDSELEMDELMEKVTEAMDAALASMGAGKKKPQGRKPPSRKK